MPFIKSPNTTEEKTDTNKENAIEEFGEQAATKNLATKRTYKKRKKYNKSGVPKPSTGITVPLYEDELLLLRKLSKKEERSMRTIARRLLSQALTAEMEKNEP